MLEVSKEKEIPENDNPDFHVEFLELKDIIKKPKQGNFFIRLLRRQDSYFPKGCST